MKYKFSIILSIYNVEEYLEESIESILKQTIGFKENIQLILINDGSPDNSDIICKKYKKLYPDNIVYFVQENKGLSEARNKGIELSQGEYVNFCDPDDKLELNACEKVCNFFRVNYKIIDIVVLRLNFFEAQTGFGHPLNNKFTDDKIIDLKVDYNLVQAHCASAFFKKEVLKNKKFDKRVKYGEDLKFINELFLENSKYGVLKSTSYNYRKRVSKTSLIDKSAYDVSWYINTLKYGYVEMFDLSKKKYGFIPKYLMFIVMYDLQWKIKNVKGKTLLEKDIYEEHLRLVNKLLIDIDDDIILEQQSIDTSHKLVAFKIKRNELPQLELKQQALYYNNINIYDVSKDDLFKINSLELKDNKFFIEGEYISFLESNDFKLYFVDEVGIKHYLLLTEIESRRKYAINNNVSSKTYEYNINFSLKKINSLKVVIEYKNCDYSNINLSYGFNAKLNKTNSKYYFNNGKIVEEKQNTLIIKKSSKINHIKAELLYIKELIKEKRFKIISYRLIYFAMKKTCKKNIILISFDKNCAEKRIYKFSDFIRNKFPDSDIYLVGAKKKYKKKFYYLRYGFYKHKIISLLADKTYYLDSIVKLDKLFSDEYDGISDLVEIIKD